MRELKKDSYEKFANYGFEGERERKRKKEKERMMTILSYRAYPSNLQSFNYSLGASQKRVIMYVLYLD